VWSYRWWWGALELVHEQQVQEVPVALEGLGDPDNLEVLDSHVLRVGH
jgi:hypothetical protein